MKTSKKFRSLFLILGFLSSFFLSSCTSKLNLVEPSSGRALESYQAKGKERMVVTPNKEATEIGLSVLEKGGTAVDAAIAVSFALSVLRPQSTGLGGGGFMLYYDKKEKKTTAFNFREFAPLKAKKEMFLRKGIADPKLSAEGALSIAVPRFIAGLGDIYDKVASKKIPWPELVQPSIDLAGKGFPVYPNLANAIQEKETLLSHYRPSQQIFLPNGKLPKEGDVLLQKDLAKTLGVIAEKGWSGFYEGFVSYAIVKTVQRWGGLITVDDLWHVEPIETTPIEGTYRDYKIVSMPPPSSGGVTLLETLNILEQFHFGKQLGGLKPKTVHIITEALRRSFLDRSRYLGDPNFVKIPVKGLLSKDYAKGLAESIQESQATLSSTLIPAKTLTGESQSTIHFSIVDREGNAVSSTQTINSLFGSGMVAEGTGIVLNNEMDDFSESEANTIEPWKKPLSSMAPTFVFNQNGEFSMVLGSVGGPKIISSVLQTLVNQIDFGVAPLVAVAAKRFHHQYLPDELQIEEKIFTSYVESQLKRMGHTIKSFSSHSTTPMGNVGLIKKIKKGWIGVADPRGEGVANGK